MLAGTGSPTGLRGKPQLLSGRLGQIPAV